MFLHRLEQAYPGVAEKTAELGIDLESSEQALCGFFHFVVSPTLYCQIHNVVLVLRKP